MENQIIKPKIPTLLSPIYTNKYDNQHSNLLFKFKKKNLIFIILIFSTNDIHSYFYFLSSKTFVILVTNILQKYLQCKGLNNFTDRIHFKKKKNLSAKIPKTFTHFEKHAGNGWLKITLAINQREQFFFLRANNVNAAPPSHRSSRETYEILPEFQDRGGKKIKARREGEKRLRSIPLPQSLGCAPKMVLLQFSR